eukprot:scpid96859/ scgid34056/ 
MTSAGKKPRKAAPANENLTARYTVWPAFKVYHELFFDDPDLGPEKPAGKQVAESGGPEPTPAPGAASLPPPPAAAADVHCDAAGQWHAFAPAFSSTTSMSRQLRFAG